VSFANQVELPFECVKMMFTEVDVFIGNNTLVDPDIYQYWLDGYTGNVNPQIVRRARVCTLTDLNRFYFQPKKRLLWYAKKNLHCLETRTKI